MDMDMDMAGGSASTDYSDFEYQQTAFGVTLTASGNANATVVQELEPLENGGGLNSNEVAELVAMYVTVGSEYEGEEGTSPSDFEIRGVVGANFNATDTFELENTANTAGQTTIVNTTGGNPNVATYSEVEDNVFCPYRLDGSTEGSPTNAYFERHWRESTGRGPVLDSNDNVSTVLRVIKSGGNTLRGVVRLHLIWDTAEVDDAGRAFSVPK